METLFFSVTGSLLIILLGVIGYFLRIQHKDIRRAIEELGKLKGKVELLEQKANSDYKLLQQQTQADIKLVQKEIGTMARSVGSLSANVEKLLLYLAENNIIQSNGDKK